MPPATTKAKPRGYWAQQQTLLTQQAQTLSIAEIAQAHGSTHKAARLAMSRLGIPRKRINSRSTRQQQRREALAKLCQTMTVAQIAQLEGRNYSRIWQELSRLNLKAQPKAHPHYWPADKVQEMRTKAQTLTIAQLAQHYSLTNKYMHQLLRRKGIQAQPAQAPAPKPRTNAAPKRTPRPASSSLSTVPQRTSIASKAPAQIIWPDHVKVQRICTPAPPANAPIRASTMRSTYVPSQDWHRSPRAI